MKNELPLKIIEFKPDLNPLKKTLSKKSNLNSFQENKDLNNINNINNNHLSSSNSTPPKNFTSIKELKQYLKTINSEIIEKFELIDIIKSGSAGSVVKAYAKLNGKKGKLIALKFLSNGKEKDNKNIQNHNEIMIHGSLKHFNIPPIYGYYKVGNNSCIAMEMSFYGDLDNFKKKVIKRVPLSETLICYILGGIVQAVYYNHTHNKIIHMDIKQQNVLVDDYINIKLTDYSVSICYKNEKKIKLPLVGTCYYISPEVLRKETIDASDASKIDVYSIGVLLYLLAFHDYPYNLRKVDNKDYEQILKNIEKNKLEFPAEFDKSKLFLNLVKNCLNKDIKKRYSIFQLIKDPFFLGYQIILNEKEKMYNAGKFIIDLMVDNVVNFNEYIKQKEKDYFL